MLITKKTDVHSMNLVIYRKKEYSFDTNPKMNTDLDLMLGDLFLGADSETRLILSISGYNNINGWISKSLQPPVFFEGELILAENIKPGIAKKIKGSEFWKTYFDQESGWICIGDNTFSTQNIGVKFLANAIAILNNNSLKALWIKLKFE